MSSHLTAGQQALLEANLQLRQQELDRLLKEHQDGLSRAEHARELLTADSDDVKHREADRSLDMVRIDREIAELGEVGAALRRLREGQYGSCEDCGADVPYDRLKIEPWARRCVGCESRRERARR
ncbi:MAG TPA: TraR/DksA family transcriptional regulator [Rubrivivax sp.]|nr:TraR/DksA family transcriptional regulator [Rubrivivax sp.]HRY87890.1 TraR/DksA family transcriptional regulator [Rubrivivax sp.]HRZ59695.1 TraR/DksA family transcriptional regulator [Rubrivivax sp.]